MYYCTRQGPDSCENVYTVNSVHQSSACVPRMLSYWSAHMMLACMLVLPLTASGMKPVESVKVTVSLGIAFRVGAVESSPTKGTDSDAPMPANTSAPNNMNTITPYTTDSMTPSMRHFLASVGCSFLSTAHAMMPPIHDRSIGSR